MSVSDRTNRTWLCSVLFLDIVGYSRLSVARQMRIKQHFSDVVSRALKDYPSDDCIMLDTGDGMAICYLGDPEDILYIAIGLRDAFAALENDPDTRYAVRLGINLGPVKIVEDINGHRNTIGDGINVAQRIMNFAAPNQLLVSRTYYDVVSCLSDNYQRLFHYLGIHKDKHIRQHGVYEVLPAGSEQQAQENPDEPQAAEHTQATDNPKPVVALDEASRRALEEHVVEQVGPIGGVLVKKALAQAHNVEDVYRILAEDVPDLVAPRSSTAVPLADDASAASPQPLGDTSGTGGDFDEQLLKSIEQQLATFIGPVARILVKKASQRHDTVKALYESLAKELPTDTERERFLKQAHLHS